MGRVHYAWVVAGVAFATLVAAAGFRAAPGVLMVPLHEAGWSISTMSAAVSVNLVLYGLIAPFAAALMDRFGIRRVVFVGLLLIAAGAGLSVLATTAWHLILTWGLLIGAGTGSMTMVFAATVATAVAVSRRRGQLMLEVGDPSFRLSGHILELRGFAVYHIAKGFIVPGVRDLRKTSD